MNHDFVVVGTFWQAVEAEMARGVLAAEGVQSLLWDAIVPAVNPLLILAIGGIRLAVAAEDAARATAILEERGFCCGGHEGTPDDAAALEREAMNAQPGDDSVEEFLRRQPAKIRRTNVE